MMLQLDSDVEVSEWIFIHFLDPQLEKDLRTRSPWWLVSVEILLRDTRRRNTFEFSRDIDCRTLDNLPESSTSGTGGHHSISLT